jgi:hypothetical protein
MKGIKENKGSVQDEHTKEIIPCYSLNRMKPIRTICGKSAELCMLKRLASIATTIVLERVKLSGALKGTRVMERV